MHTAKFEGLGNVLIEAAANALAIVSTNYEYGIETIGKYARVEVVKKAEDQSLSKALLKTINNIVRIREEQLNQRNRILDAFSGRVINAKIDSLSRL